MTTPHRMTILAAMLLLATLAPASVALAQDGRPGPAVPERTGGAEPPATTGAPAASPADDEDDDAPGPEGAVRTTGVGNGRLLDELGRPIPPDQYVEPAWKDAKIDDLVTYIAQATGKVVIPIEAATLRTRSFTLITGAPVPQEMVLDLVLRAFRLNGVGVVERDDIVIIGPIDTIAQLKEQPVLDASVDVMKRPDVATLVVKIFQLTQQKAEDALSIIEEADLPSHVRINANATANQLIVYGDIAFCQYVQHLVEEMDRSFKKPRTETFRLAHADASEVQTSIEDLFSDTGSSGSATRRDPRQVNRGRGGRGGEQAPTPGGPIGENIELRTTINTQQNSVTVAGDPDVVALVADLIHSQWDLPRAPSSSKIYTLGYTDPLKVAEILNSLLGQGTGVGGARGRAGGQQGGAGVSDQLAGIYQIEAYPETSQLLVFSKTEESLAFLDSIIADLDQPTQIGLPFVVELKHANAFELAEQINALLAEPGSGASIRDQESGLSGRSLADESGTGGQNTEAGRLEFPWQRSGSQNQQESSPESPLIGKVRIVPISRQNALAILCPRPQREAVQELISYFDRPGRQVLLSVIVAEVELTDDLALGLRISSDSGILASPLSDNIISGGIDTTGENQDFASDLFDTSVLNANVSLNVILQALQQDSNLRILQQPLVFTADNQEAFFFDGQRIPFITDTQIVDGNPRDSFEYEDVGVILNARPRITSNRDVDLELRLELSSVVPGQTLFGGAIIDKRETTTNVVVKNGQTIVLSGILRESESMITRKVPLLGDIPLLGELFKSRENQTVTSELVAFITPLVVDDPGENDRNFQQEWRDRLERLTRPVTEQAEDWKNDPDTVRDSVLPREGGVSIEGRTGSAEPLGSGAEIYQPPARRGGDDTDG